MNVDTDDYLFGNYVKLAKACAESCIKVTAGIGCSGKRKKIKEYDEMRKSVLNGNGKFFFILSGQNLFWYKVFDWYKSHKTFQESYDDFYNVVNSDDKINLYNVKNILNGNNLEEDE